MGRLPVTKWGEKTPLVEVINLSYPFIRPSIGVITLLTTGRGPLCMNNLLGCPRNQGLLVSNEVPTPIDPRSKWVKLHCYRTTAIQSFHCWIYRAQQAAGFKEPTNKAVSPTKAVQSHLIFDEM